MLFKFIHEINSGTPVPRSTVLVEAWHYTGQTARDSGSYGGFNRSSQHLRLYPV